MWFWEFLKESWIPILVAGAVSGILNGLWAWNAQRFQRRWKIEQRYWSELMESDPARCRQEIEAFWRSKVVQR